jgi:p-cumate 2,3-dioxygenase beta subunit
MSPNISSQPCVSRSTGEEFLYEEALLLDEWRLEEWLQLFTAGGRYLVPSLDCPEAGATESLYLVKDDHQRLTSRARQLMGESAWAERPHSRTRRMITNVLVREEGEHVRLLANFTVNRFRHEIVDCFIGRYEHLLARTDSGLRFLERKAILDLETLRPHGKLSIIL